MPRPLSLTKRAVAAWFHTEGRDGWTPATTLRDVLDVCLNAAFSRGLTFSVGEVVLRRLFCEALCVLYQRKSLAFRRTPPAPLPDGWADEPRLRTAFGRQRIEHETLWGIYLDTELPDWSDELAVVGVCEWETDLPGWRTTLTSLFRYYVVREERLLIEAGLLFEEEEDEEGA